MLKTYTLNIRIHIYLNSFPIRKVANKKNNFLIKKTTPFAKNTNKSSKQEKCYEKQQTRKNKCTLKTIEPKKKDVQKQYFIGEAEPTANQRIPFRGVTRIMEVKMEQIGNAINMSIFFQLCQTDKPCSGNAEPKCVYVPWPKYTKGCAAHCRIGIRTPFCVFRPRHVHAFWLCVT